MYTATHLVGEAAQPHSAEEHAKQRHGAERGERVLGELYAVDTVSMLIYSDRLRRIPWERLAFVDVDGLGTRYDIITGRRPDSTKLVRLGLVSRFPQGLSGPLLAQVLVVIKQDALEDVP